MSAYLGEWLSLLGRWIHLVTGIAWIGASFYFVWLDNHLVPPVDDTALAKGVGGELWAVHGGGFYNAQKYRIAPPVLPPTLHWFYWEAYSTWLSGMFLLCLLYYGQAETYLIDAHVAPLGKPAAIGLGLGVIAGGWFIYDLLCRSALAQRVAWLSILLGLLGCGAAYALCHLFSGRGAFIEFGAMLGTIMVANVFCVIIPGQRAMVRAKREGLAPDAQAGARGKQRSVHNTYFTLPVLFTMISNHYAGTFGARYNWLVLIALSAAGALIRRYFVLRHRARERGGATPSWPALLGVALIIATAAVLAPRPARTGGADTAAAAARKFTAVQAIVARRCAPCHALEPTQAGFSAPPNGIVFDTPQSLLRHADQIATQLESRAMPLGNLTGMTDEERSLVLDWADHDAAR